MDKLRFLLVLHNHQPLGNFDDVIQRLMDKAYRPFLEAIRDRPALKLTLHVSGPLLLWLERRASDYLDLVGELVQRGQVELLTGGLYEPILSAIPYEDRVAQIDLMSERLRSRFGVRPRGSLSVCGMPRSYRRSPPHGWRTSSWMTEPFLPPGFRSIGCMTTT